VEKIFVPTQGFFLTLFASYESEEGFSKSVSW